MYWNIALFCAVASAICLVLGYFILKGPRRGFAKAMGAIFGCFAAVLAFFALTAP